tara:strand:- start:129 stop:722 length:594 start_codon:yes stop_codon:yes gene_type:complete
MKDILLPIFSLLFLCYGFAQDNTKVKIDSLTTQINRCSNCSHLLYDRAQLYLENDDKMLAMKDFNEAIEIHLEHFHKNHILTEYYNDRAFLKSELKDYRGAIQDYSNAIEVHSGYATLWEEVFFGRAYCKSNIDDIDGAIEDYEMVFIHNPDDYVSHFNLGLLKIQKGLKDEGCLNLSKAGELGYEDAYKIISEYCN